MYREGSDQENRIKEKSEGERGKNGNERERKKDELT